MTEIMSPAPPVRIIFLTNIVAPYRVTLFNSLENIRDNNIFDFSVYFMRPTERGRSWNINFGDLKFKYLVGRGFYANLIGMHFHFNPILLLRAALTKREIVLGASWNNINVVVLILLKRIGLIRNRLSIWSEANYLSLGSSKGGRIKFILRRFVFNSIDGCFVVSGKMPLVTFERWGVNERKAIYLPNLVSSRFFMSDKNASQLEDHPPQLLIVARLVESFKGILNFLEAVGQERLRAVRLRIVGEGPSLADYRNYVRSNGLDEFVTFCGQLDSAAVVREYQKADAFVLPSFSDQSPLVVVEACFAGLPLLISERCGNHYEALKAGKNGYKFDPYDPVDIRSKFDQFILARDFWPEFGRVSKKIAEEEFDEEKVLRRLIEGFCAENMTQS